MKYSYFVPFAFLVLIAACNEKKEETKPSVSNMTESVYASVTIQPEDLYDVFSASAGILEKVFIEEGDLVKKGQTLARVSTTQPKLNIENARLGVDLAQKNVEQQGDLLTSIADEIVATKNQLQLDSINYERQKKLWAQNIGAKSELENRKLKYELVQKNLQVLRKKYRQTELELENNLQRSQNNLRQAKSVLTDYFIKARLTGKVYELLKNEGELISQQTPLARIGQTNSFLVEMLIDEVDIAKVSLGQVALIHLDAYPNEVFEVEVTKIYPLKNSRTQTFKVEGKFRKPPSKLYAGLSGEANIVLSEKKNTLTIPLAYLLENGKVKTAEGEVAVKLGMRNLERVEVLSGIDTATVLQKP